MPNTKAKCSADQALRIPIVVPPGEVEIIKVPDEPVVNAGDQIGFTIVISNTQATPAANARITDTLPPGLTWRVVPSVDSAACSIAGGVLSCSWGTLNPGQSRQVRIVAPTSVADCGPVENIAYLSYWSGNPPVLKYGQAEAISGVACANIEVDKITVPGGAAQPFNFQLRTETSLLQTFTLTDTQPIFVSADLTPTMTYIVEEIVPPGWQNLGAHCDNSDAPISVRPVTSALRSSPALGSTVLCTFTNTQLASVEMVKTALGGSGTFHFALHGEDFGDDFRTVSVRSGMTGSVTWRDREPGPYTIEELDPGDEWQASAITCTIYPPTGSPRSDDASFVLAAGERAVCAIANAQRGQIVIQKVTEPTSREEFGFSTSFGPNVGVVAGQPYDSPMLDPGTYTVTESLPLPNGWDLVGSACSDGSPTSAISLGAGETITCTFTNRQRGSITVVKQIQGVGIRAYDTTFQFYSTGGMTTTNPFDITTSGTKGQAVFGNLPAGAYSVVEVPQAGWEPVSANCRGGSSPNPAAIVLGAGEDITCTFVNRRLSAGIRLDKLVTSDTDTTCAAAHDEIEVPANTEVIYCFRMYNTGSVTITTPVVLVDAVLGIDQVLDTVPQIAPGAQAVYTSTHNWGPDLGSYPNTATVTGATSLGPVSDSDDALVTIVDEQGVGLAVQKLVGPSGGPYDQTTADDPFVTDAGVQLQWQWIVTNTGTVDLYLTQIVDLLDSSLYDLIAQGGCPALPAPLAPGALYICTSPAFPAAGGLHINQAVVQGCAAPAESEDCLVKDDIAAYVTRPQLALTKIVDNIWGGTLSAADFPLQVSGSGAITPVTSGVTVTLGTGDYLAAEQQQPGYTSSGFGGDCAADGSISLANGDAKSCTITNTDTPAELTVTKVVIAADYDHSFELTLDNTPIGTASSGGATIGPLPIAAGQHVVGESGPLGEYVTEIGGDCDGTGHFQAALGQSYSCTITNTRKADIVVVKATIPPDNTTAFPFTASFTSTTFALTDGQAAGSGLLPPGTYAVKETVPAGWEQVAAGCSNGSEPSGISLRAGETVTCTFTNRQMGAIQLRKQLVPPGASAAFSFTASYAPDGFSLADGGVHASGFLPAGVYTVAETAPLPGGWVQTGFDCSDGSTPSNLNLDPGELMTCTITNTLVDGQVIIQKFTDPHFATQPFTFTTNFAGDVILTGPGPAFVSDPLPPTTARTMMHYSVRELMPADWHQALALCLGQDRRVVASSFIDLRAGETVTCNYFNTEYPFLSLGLGKQRSPGQAASVEVGHDVNFSIVVTNTSAVTLTNLLVSEYFPDELGLSPNDNHGWALTADGRGAVQVVPVIRSGDAITLPILLRALAAATGPVVNRVTLSGGTYVNGLPLPDYLLEAAADVTVTDPTGSDPGDEPLHLPGVYLPFVAGE